MKILRMGTGTLTGIILQPARSDATGDEKMNALSVKKQNCVVIFTHTHNAIVSGFAGMK